MEKHRYLLWLILCVFAPACSNTPGSNEHPPNIVFIFADDLGIGDLGTYGNNVIKTPSIDALAEGGVKFTQGYVSHPVCSPSRAGLLTGRYQQRHGWEFNPAGRDVKSGMSVAEETFADAMKSLGYVTGMVGKWHLGYGKGHHPLDRGFDEYFGVLAGGSLFIDPKTPGVESLGRLASKRHPRQGVFRGRDLIEVDEYLTDVFTDEAVAFIDRHREEPFFLYLSHTTPHTPLQATEKYVSRYQHVEDPAQRIYSAMVSSLDDSVAAVVQKLKDIGEYENTLIVFMSDNGCAGYIGNACSNAPHAGFKRYHQEGGIRVPTIFHWPDRLKPQVFDHPVISLDLFATFTGAGGQTKVTEDSVDLIPYLTNEKSDAPHDYLYWRSGPTAVIRDERWKLIRYKRSPFTRTDLRQDGRLQPPPDGWDNSAPNGYVTLLYDLAADAGEQNNLASSHPEVVERLGRVHAVWADTLTATPILPGFRSTIADMHGEAVQLIF